MAKKRQIENIYETDQANKKHRKKNKKLQKREKHKKDKKKTKKVNHEKRKMHKYIAMAFKENQKELDLARLPMDLDEVVKQVDKLIKLNKASVKEVPELFRIMEEESKEINLSGLEDLSAQKYICKLFKNFKLTQNPKNPFKFKIREFTINPMARSTTEVDYVIRQCISSFYLFVKSIFEFHNFKLNTAAAEEEKNNNNINKNRKNGDDEEEAEQSNDASSESEYSEESSEASGANSNNDFAAEKLKDKSIKKRLDEMKYEIDYENHLIEEQFGGNAELVNKAFHKIMNDDQLFKNKNIDSILDDDKNKKTDKVPAASKLNSINSPENAINKKEFNSESEKLKKVIGPTIPDFLASTMKLLQSSENNEVFEKAANNFNKPETNLDNLLNDITYNKERTNIYKKQNKSKTEINSNKIEPINKESYDRILKEERLHQKQYQSQMEDYESKYRSTSLLEMHQEKLAKEKGKNSNKELMLRRFDREKVMNVGTVDSKRALGIMQDKQGLKGRFEQKEKYIGY